MRKLEENLTQIICLLIAFYTKSSIKASESYRQCLNFPLVELKISHAFTSAARADCDTSFCHELENKEIKYGA